MREMIIVLAIAALVLACYLGLVVAALNAAGRYHQ